MTRHLAYLRAIFLLFPHVAFSLLPEVDFARMGVVGIAGTFAGLDFATNSTPSFDPTTSTLLSRSTSDGSLITLSSTNAGGSILAACDLGGKTYVAGLFTSIGGVQAANIAYYDPSTSSFSALVSGLDAQVDALYCDTSSNTLWVGGKFHAPVDQDASSYGGALALYTPSSNSWSPAPFVGLTGASSEVLSITPSYSGSSLYLGGSFVISFESGTPQPTVNSSSNPNVPSSYGATPFSSALVPIPISAADINANPSTTEAGFSNITEILCPAGPDGSGSTWLSENGFSSVITVRTFSALYASGIRLGNTFLDGRGTTAFTLATIPNDNVVTLNYTDPTTSQVLTCSSNCPLLTNSSIPYQDFLFVDGIDTITGFQLTLSEWIGAGPGLHLLQLLSDGAFVSAVSSLNSPSCFAPKSSSTAQTGSWDITNVSTSIAGTTQEVLVATVPVGTTSSASPSLSWDVYVSASGEYNVYFLIPGCTEMQDCSLRSSVDITIYPGGGLSSVVKTVSEIVDDDTQQLIYTGSIVPSAPDYTITISMTLSSSPDGTGEGGMYDIVADRILLELLSVNTTGTITGSEGTGSSSASVEMGWGFFEWNTATSVPVNATSSSIPNSTITSFDSLSLKLYSALATSPDVASGVDVIQTIAPFNSSLIFVAGTFTIANGPVNIASFDGTTLGALSDQGLNGPVAALIVDSMSGNLYVGGSFTDTYTGGSGSRYKGIVMYDVASGEWSALSGGLNGAVTDLILSNNQLVITGNFTSTLDSSSSNGTPVGGLAVWDIASSSWVNSGGFLISTQMTLVANSSAGVEFIAGNVVASSQYGADGWARIYADNQGQPAIQSSPMILEESVSSSSSSSTTKRRSAKRQPIPWFPNFSSLLFPRQSTSPSTSTPSPLPALPLTPAPSVLSGIFWTNTSSSIQMVILGGNFSLPSGEGVAIYDPSTNATEPLKGNQLNGTVWALEIIGDQLFVGGEFGLGGSSNVGFAIYDLVTEAWVTGTSQPLQTSDGSNVVVRVLESVPSQSDILLVAGTFTSVGSLSCEAICSWDTSSNQWSALGSGIVGELSSIDFAGSDYNVIAAGSVVLSDGTAANVAQYTFGNSSWSPVGVGSDIPGPVTAVSVNNQNESSIFAAGSASDGSNPFFLYWDGTKWNSLNNTLLPSTTVMQLEMVPLIDTHNANGVIETDRVLLLSGSLSSSTFGNASSVLFDGATYYPYIVSTSPSGTPALMSSFFHSYTSFSFSQSHYLAVGVVILISIAIAAGIVFFLLLAGILWTLFSRDSELPTTQEEKDESDDASSHRRPSSLLEHINAATRTTILGVGSAALTGQHLAEDTGETQVEPEHDGSGWLRTETPALAKAGGVVGGDDEEEQGRPSHARYSFQAAGNGELSLRTGAEVVILDDRDPDWWYARDTQTGQEGVVPAAYLY